jgi:hypothetical protein
MASQPPYPIDMPISDDALAPDTEVTSPPAAHTAVSAPETPPETTAESASVEPVTNASDPAGPTATATPSAAPAPATQFGPKSVRGGNMSMRVLSRAMQDLDLVTGGTRAATYDEVDEYVGRAIKTERGLEQAALARQDPYAGRPAADVTEPNPQTHSSTPVEPAPVDSATNPETSGFPSPQNRSGEPGYPAPSSLQFLDDDSALGKPSLDSGVYFRPSDAGSMPASDGPKAESSDGLPMEAASFPGFPGLPSKIPQILPDPNIGEKFERLSKTMGRHAALYFTVGRPMLNFAWGFDHMPGSHHQVATVMRDFVNGTGPEESFFGPKDEFTLSFSEAWSTQHAVSNAIDKWARLPDGIKDKFVYQAGFGVLSVSLDTALFNPEAHAIGSFTLTGRLIGPNNIEWTASNAMSLKSFFADNYTKHIGISFMENNERPEPYGTTKQYIVWNTDFHGNRR